jgi:hypothetical protein
MTRRFSILHSSTKEADEEGIAYERFSYAWNNFSGSISASSDGLGFEATY